MSGRLAERIMILLGLEQRHEGVAALLSAAGIETTTARTMTDFRELLPARPHLAVLSWNFDGGSWRKQIAAVNASCVGPKIAVLLPGRPQRVADPVSENVQILLGRCDAESASSIAAFLSTQIAPDDPVVRSGEFVINRESFRAWRRGALLELSIMQFHALLTFAGNPGVVFTRAEMLATLWSADDAISLQSVTRFVSDFRKRISPRRMPPPIVSIRGIGYALAHQERRALRR